ncbi:hypothetical protein HOY80DRAFT_211061 [Tuber brumale]|nr:hypothetical protein HOY80DRAFT_211061 [Tuber brumale]
MQNLLSFSFPPRFYSILGGLISVFYTFAIFLFYFVHSRARSLIGGIIMSHYVCFAISFFSSKGYGVYLLFCMIAEVLASQSKYLVLPAYLLAWCLKILHLIRGDTGCCLWQVGVVVSLPNHAIICRYHGGIK